MSNLKSGSLFSGYGGLDMAIEAVLGAQTAWVSEIDPAPSRILAARFPGVPNLGDITAVDWDAVEPVDVLTGGFPCQDVSIAGGRAGLRDGTRSGLWYQMARAIDILRPRLVVAENVRGLLSAEADGYVEPCPWCLGEAGDGEPAMRALGAVLADLASLGYDTAWVGLPASGVGAPHGRFRIFVLAWPADAEGPGLEAGREGRCGGGLAAVPADLGHERTRSLRDGRPGPADSGSRAVGLLPTPQAMDTAGAMADRRSTSGYGPALRDITALLPTPKSGDATTGHNALTGGRPVEQSTHLTTQVALLPTPAAQEPGGTAEQYHARLAAHDGREATFLPLSMLVQEEARFGQYAPAIARWEAILGRPAPAPTEPTGRDGAHRLSPRFVEFLMGLPDGWVTDTDTTRNEQLKALGNGVVPQQAAEAIRHLLTIRQHALTQEIAA